MHGTKPLTASTKVVLLTQQEQVTWVPSPGSRNQNPINGPELPPNLPYHAEDADKTEVASIVLRLTALCTSPSKSQRQITGQSPLPLSAPLR